MHPSQDSPRIRRRDCCVKALGLDHAIVNADGHAVTGRTHRPNDEKRSVVILRAADYDEWLQMTNVEAARSTLTLYPADEMLAEPASIWPTLGEHAAQPHHRFVPRLTGYFQVGSDMIQMGVT